MKDRTHKLLSHRQRTREVLRACSTVLFLLIPVVSTERAMADPPRVGHARAEPLPAQVAEAHQLLEEARALVTKSLVVQAVKKFEESIANHETSEALLGLGDCYDRLDRTASAFRAFERAKARALQEGNSAVVEEAQARLDALGRRLRYLRIVTRDGTTIETVTLDGRTLAPSEVGKDIPVDPGQHSLAVSGIGLAPFSKTIEISPERRVEDIRIASCPNEPEPVSDGRHPKRGLVGVIRHERQRPVLARCSASLADAKATDDEPGPRPAPPSRLPEPPPSWGQRFLKELNQVPAAPLVVSGALLPPAFGYFAARSASDHSVRDVFLVLAAGSAPALLLGLGVAGIRASRQQSESPQAVVLVKPVVSLQSAGVIVEFGW